MRNFTFLLGIVVSPKDSDELLIKSLNSILNQTYLPDEIIVLQNGKLNSFKIKLINAFQKKLSDIVRIIENDSTLDFAFGLNLIINNTKCDYLIRQDPDDISLNNRIETIINEIEIYKYDFYHSGTYEFNRRTLTVLKKTIPTTLEEIRKKLQFVNPINHSSVTLSINLIKKCNFYENIRFAEDYQLWLKIFQSNLNIGHNDSQLVIFDSTNKLKKRSSLKIFNTEIELFKHKLKLGYPAMLTCLSFFVRFIYLVMPIYLKNIIDVKTSILVDNLLCLKLDNINSFPLQRKTLET